MDSKLVIEQMSGRWKVKHPDMAPLHQQATSLSTRFDRVTYTWIPRAKNSHADRLANEAMDAASELQAPAEEGKAEGQRSNPASWTGARGAPTRFLLLRHGQTELSVERRYSGRGNPALTDLGRRQAEAAAQFIAQMGGIAAVITSPLQRAHDTASAAAKALGLDVSVDADLIETDFGAWEGLTFSEAAERDPELHRKWLRDTSESPPDGESFDAAAERVGRARARIISEHPGETVLVVSHVTPIKTLLRIALDAGDEHPLPDAPRSRVAVDRRVLSRRCGLGAAGQSNRLSRLAVQMKPFAVRTEYRDRLDGTVHHAEPMRCPR